MLYDVTFTYRSDNDRIEKHVTVIDADDIDEAVRRGRVLSPSYVRKNEIDHSVRRQPNENRKPNFESPEIRPEENRLATLPD